MLNLFQHLIKSTGYETLKRVQGDKITIMAQSLTGEGLPCGVEDFTPQGRGGGEINSFILREDHL